MKMKFYILAFVAMLSIGVLAVQAEQITDGGFASGITNSSSWTAGSDNTGQWYGQSYRTNSGFAQLNANNNRRSIVQAFDIAAGDYDISYDLRFSSVLQWKYVHVLAVQSGTEISLGDGGRSSLLSLDLGDDGIGFTISQDGISDVYRGTAGLFDSTSQWNSYSDTFTVTEDIASNYDYLLFSFTASKFTGRQIAGIDNVSIAGPSSVPAPATMLLLLSGGLAMFAVRRKREREAI